MSVISLPKGGCPILQWVAGCLPQMTHPVTVAGAAPVLHRFPVSSRRRDTSVKQSRLEGPASPSPFPHCGNRPKFAAARVVSTINFSILGLLLKELEICLAVLAKAALHPALKCRSSAVFKASNGSETISINLKQRSKDVKSKAYLDERSVFVRIDMLRRPTLSGNMGTTRTNGMPVPIL